MKKFKQIKQNKNNNKYINSKKNISFGLKLGNISNNHYNNECEYGRPASSMPGTPTSSMFAASTNTESYHPFGDATEYTKFNQHFCAL